MLAYNGSVPGPTLRVQQDSSHRQRDQRGRPRGHGALARPAPGEPLRRDARDAGADPGRRAFTYRVEFPDPGVYWYHPHIREDYGQEMGLYGNIVVAPADPDYWPPVDRELALTLDDVLIEDGRIAPFSPTETNYVAMGRFGNVLLVNGETRLSLGAKQGEVVRLYLTNTANTRVFNVALPGARMKLVGGDSGRYEREEFVDGRHARALGARRRRRAVRRAGRADARAPDARPHVPLAGSRSRTSTPSRRSRASSRRSGRTPTWLAERARSLPHLEADPGQDARVRRRDGHGRAGAATGATSLRLPDAPGGHRRCTRPLPEVRHEAPRDRAPSERLRLPDAPRGHEPISLSAARNAA